MEQRTKEINNLDQFTVLIPLRGGSKAIPKKNLQEINGYPLFYYSVKAATELGLKTFVSTEDELIKTECLKHFPSLSIVHRPYELAQDNSSTEDVLAHFCEIEYSHKHIVLLQATSPLTTSMDIKRAITKYINNSFIPLVSVVKKHDFIWDELGKPINYDPFHRPRRQDWNGYMVENGAIYIFSREHFLKSRCRLDTQCTLFEMSAESSYEIDELIDLQIVRSLMEK